LTSFWWGRQYIVEKEVSGELGEVQYTAGEKGQDSSDEGTLLFREGKGKLMGE